VAALQAPRFPSRLTLRIYGLGILQFALVAFGMFVFARQTMPAPQGLSEKLSPVLTLALESKLADRKGLQTELTRLERDSGWSIAIYDHAEKLVVGTGRLPPSTPRGAFRKPGTRNTPLHFPDGTTGTLRFSMPRPPAPPAPWFPIALVLVVVGVTAWLTARSLARPLAALSSVAAQFGSGQLTARAAHDRDDEFGDLARSFNDMAQRISRLMGAEKELIANVSHELRTPLARIQVALDLAAEGDAESARESLKEITEDLAELERIVDDVLTAARLALSDGTASTGAMPPIRVEEVDVQVLMDRAVARFRAAHPERPVEVKFGSVLPNSRADAVLLRRAIDNLLDNADKYTEEPASPIELTAHRAGADIVVEVRDRGIGIAPEDADRVFEPFFRADRSRARARGGYGLGLALARRIVEAHAGTLRLLPRPGGGTVARIEFPIDVGYSS
jgi:two-component system OmpR family sensor kinase